LIVSRKGVRSVDFECFVRELRSKLPDFDLFEAAYLRGYSQREIAERLGVSERMIRRRLKRVRDEIAQVLERDFLA